MRNIDLEPRLWQQVRSGISGLDIMHGELKLKMLEADKELEEAQRIEEENGYSDAMESMERKYAEGFLDALTYCYKLTYDVSFAVGARE